MGSTGRHGGWAALDPAVPERTRALTEALRATSEKAGRPSFRQLRTRSARTADVVLTPTTLHRMFTPNPGRAGGSSLPEWTYYATLLRVLGADPGDFHAQWESAQEEWRNRTPAEPSPAAEPSTASPSVVRLPPESDVIADAEPRGRSRRLLTPRSIAAGLIGLIIGGAVAVGVTELTPGPADAGAARTLGEQPPQPHPDGSDPEATGCADTGRLTTFYSHLYPHWPVQSGPHSVAVVTLEYSPPCRTVWVVLRDAAPGAVATLYRGGAHPATLSCRAGPDGSCATAQLNDVGANSHATARSGQYYAQTRSI